MWFVPLVVAVAGVALVAYLVSQLHREIEPTQRSIRMFGREVRPAVVRVRDETARTRDRLRRG